MNLDDRASTILHALIEQYIEQGTPIASQAVLSRSGLPISPATARNVMVDLEHMGLIASPHTSSGRVPTAAGYRLYVQAVLTSQTFTPLPTEPMANSPLHITTDTPTRMANQAAATLSELSQFAGVIVTPQRSPVFGQIDFLPLSSHRILVVMISPEGDVQNRLLQVDTPYTPAQLVSAANYLNSHYSGKTFAAIGAQLAQELSHLQTNVNRLMQQAVQLSAHTLTDDESLIVKGERHLLHVHEFANNMEKLRQTFDLFDEKTRLMQLLDGARTAQGVQIFIGGESEALPFEGLSLVTAPYHAHGQVVGTLGVIGPSRMAYDKVIPIVDVTAKLLSRAMQT